MRMRKKKNLGPRLARCAPVLVSGPQAYRGRWRELFGSDAPLRLEIGCGKGRFALETARREPGVNLVAVEREEGALVMAAEKAMEAQLPNLRFLSFDAAQLGDVFAPGEVDLIYLNFSDPWPKARHARRRLTSREYFSRYDLILARGGQVEFKTDNRALFDFSTGQLDSSDTWEIAGLTYDLHRDGSMCAGNVMTEYEARFSSAGTPICKLIAKRRAEGDLCI